MTGPDDVSPVVNHFLGKTLDFWLAWAYGIVASAIVFMFRKIFKQAKKEKQEREAVTRSTQLVLKDMLIQIILEWEPKGYCPYFVRDRFESLYDEFVILHGKGSLISLRDRLLSLPSTPPQGQQGSEVERRREYESSREGLRKYI